MQRMIDSEDETAKKTSEKDDVRLHWMKDAQMQTMKHVRMQMKFVTHKTFCEREIVKVLEFVTHHQRCPKRSNERIHLVSTEMRSEAWIIRSVCDSRCSVFTLTLR